MNILFKLLLFFSLLLTTTNTYSADYNATTLATAYKITITRIQLCETGSTTASCLNPVELYNGTSGSIDIASTEAGQAAASLGNASKAEFGKSYTHMQVTMSRSVTIQGGKAAMSTGSQACYTNGTAGTASQSALGSTSSGNLADTTVYMAIAGTTDNGDNINSVNAADGTGTAASTGTITSGHEYLEWRGALTSPFKPTPGDMPTIKLAFGTANALGFYNPNTTTNDCDTRAAGATTTGFYAAEPDVTMKFE